MTYVYPVLSRRAGGVSVGINLNPNNACNWRCIYCQVPDLKRGGPPPIDLRQLGNELRDMLNWLYVGDYLDRHVPPEARRVVDIAFSGNGEPTMAPEFSEAVALVTDVLDSLALAEAPRLRLITNGSQIERAGTRQGIAALGARSGEVWFKVDAVGVSAMRRINGSGIQPDTLMRRLRLCGSLAETWVQTCVFALDGHSPDETWMASYLSSLSATARHLRGVYLYGLARPSCQPEARRLSALPVAAMERLAERIQQETGLTVRMTP